MGESCGFLQEFLKFSQLLINMTTKYKNKCNITLQ